VAGSANDLKPLMASAFRYTGGHPIWRRDPRTEPCNGQRCPAAVDLAASAAQTWQRSQ
jgi:hypothetical protein